MVKVVDPTLQRNVRHRYSIKIEIDRQEINVICDALSFKIHRGITDPHERKEYLDLYGEMFPLWEATSEGNQVPLDTKLIRIDDPTKLSPLQKKKQDLQNIAEKTEQDIKDLQEIEAFEEFRKSKPPVVVEEPIPE